jgi:peptidoglycan hydrolase-like protein with peptidoglycan-binding domain
MSTQQTPTRRPSPDAQPGRSGGPAILEPDGLGPTPAPPRRRALRWLAGTLVVAVLGGAAWWAGGHPGLDTSTKAATPTAATATATVARQDLNGQTKVSGTLGYAGSASVQSPLSGRITWLPTAGQVIGRGGTLLSVDNQAVQLFYGPKPAWRDLAEGVDDGPDVKQLEQNLAALGYDPDHQITVDNHYSWATAAAVKRWQKARGLDRTGTFTTTMPAVFLPWAVRVNTLGASVGGQAAPGQPAYTVTSDRHQVSVDLDVSQQGYVKAGDRVEVVMPDGRRVKGRVSDVGRVAQTSGDPPNQTTTIPVTVALDHPNAGGRLDQAPVDVYVTTQSRKGVLAVPVSALLALAEGGYAVETIDPSGQHHLVAVRLGVFSGGMVEVTGSDLRAGMRVVTSQ